MCPLLFILDHFVFVTLNHPNCTIPDVDCFHATFVFPKLLIPRYVTTTATTTTTITTATTTTITTTTTTTNNNNNG